MSDPTNTAPASAFERLVRSRWYGPGGILGLSKASGVSRATLYSWFRGESVPDTRSLARLGSVLELTIVELVDSLNSEPTLGASIDPEPSAPMPAALRLAAQISPMPMLAEASAAQEHRRRGAGATIGEALPRGEVFWCTPDDPIGPVARTLYERHFSQAPVRGERGWMGLLTTEAVARWMAGRSRHDLDVEARAPVREVLAYADDAGDFRVVEPSAPAGEVLALFDDATSRGWPIRAVLVDGGRTANAPVGIVTAFDLPRLRRSTTPSGSKSRP